jgi:hypothetical protein
MVTAETLLPTQNLEAEKLTTRMDTFENNVTNMMNIMSDMLEGKESKKKSVENEDKTTRRNKRANNWQTPDRPNGVN